MPAGASPAAPADATVLAPAGSPLTPILSPASLGFGMEGGLWFLDVVKAATEGFADKNVIGRGGFGTVYKVRGRTARDVRVEKMVAVTSTVWRGERRRCVARREKPVRLSAWREERRLCLER